ncbi:Rne/Rng family ribonuclease [Microlunatus ginsengisoli]|uniref:S1 motif domain-containing protein n=1 Tax=Microlunatus ginsengisoli TaxID=363863 RepID=A0ABP6ZPJ0_9ACTN
MLDIEQNDQSDESSSSAAGSAEAPPAPRRRRAATRPAGPPKAAAPGPEQEGAPAGAPAAESAGTPPAKKAAKRAPRKTAKAAAASTEAGEAGTPPATARAPRKRSAKKAAAAPPAESASTEDTSPPAEAVETADPAASEPALLAPSEAALLAAIEGAVAGGEAASVVHAADRPPVVEEAWLPQAAGEAAPEADASEPEAAPETEPAAEPASEVPSEADATAAMESPAEEPAAEAPTDRAENQPTESGTDGLGTGERGTGESGTDESSVTEEPEPAAAVEVEDGAPEPAQSEPAQPEPAQSEPAQAEPVEAETSEQDEAQTDDSDDDEDDDGDESDAESKGEEGSDGEPSRRRRRRRGGRRRRRGGGGGESEDGPSDSAQGPSQPDAQAEQSSAATSGTADSETGTGTGEAATGDGASESGAGEQQSDDAGSGEAGGSGDAGGSGEADGSAENGDGQRRRRRRRRRRGEDSGGSPDDPAEVVVRVREPGGRRKASDEPAGIEGSTRLEAKRQRRREGREAGRRRAPILSEAEFLARRESVKRAMVIRQREDPSTGSGGALTQIAVLEDDILVEHYVDRDSAASLIGNVYLGRVQNVLPSMEAAFIDIGRGRNAVLYAGEVDWDSFGAEGQARKVEKVLKSGQTVLVQVTKDPVGAKGARLTNHVSIPGRYIVYAPGGHLSGISRKLPDTERKRLKDILADLVPDSASVIVRTAAEGASEDELVRDVNRLKAQWEDIERKVKAGQAPQLLYGEPDLTLRIVRDLFTEDFSELLVAGNNGQDDAYDAIEGYVGHVAPHLADRLKRWAPEDGSDIFGAYRIDEQIAKALERKVFLPSGGSLVIDRTEAMTVIDVNTGKFTGTGGNLEATVTSNNLEAAEEIVRQLRLRDIGGIIVIDFIDMVLPSNRELLLRRLVECLGRDRTRHQVAEVTSLGLVQMTRKKIGTGLLEAFSTECEHCHGRGYDIHDMPVESQKQADGGARERDRGGRPQRGGRRGGGGRGGSNGGSSDGGSHGSNGSGGSDASHDRSGEAATPVG